MTTIRCSIFLAMVALVGCGSPSSSSRSDATGIAAQESRQKTSRPRLDEEVQLAPLLQGRQAGTYVVTNRNRGDAMDLLLRMDREGWFEAWKAELLADVNKLSDHELEQSVLREADILAYAALEEPPTTLPNDHPTRTAAFERLRSQRQARDACAAFKSTDLKELIGRVDRDTPCGAALARAALHFVEMLATAELSNRLGGRYDRDGYPGHLFLFGAFNLAELRRLMESQSAHLRIEEGDPVGADLVDLYRSAVALQTTYAKVLNAERTSNTPAPGPVSDDHLVRLADRSPNDFFAFIARHILVLARQALR